VLAEIAKLDAENGASERQTASRVARITSSTPKQAGGEVAMAKQVAALPGIADAHARGEISNNQLGAVAAIASASSEDEALELAKKGTSAQLHRRAAASRGKLFEERRKAQTGRYLAFKPEEDGQSTRIHGRLPFAESKHLEAQLRKIADRLGLCDKERSSPSARMADALLILTKHNPSQALHDHEEQSAKQPAGQTSERTAGQTSERTAGQTSERTAGQPDEQATKPTAGQNGERRTHQTRQDTGLANADTGTPAGSSSQNTTARPKLYAVVSPTARTTKPVIDYDEDPFPEVEANNAPSEPYEEDTVDEEFAVEDTAQVPSVRQVVVQRADTRVIIHWNAQSGEVNYENGPPIDHPRLLALLCDAQIDLQHCDPNGLPTGLITTQHHSTWRQDRYLAFRDGPCRIPECEGIGKTQAHHIFEDRIDRVTSVKHMINVCNRCHQEHHDGTFAITGDPEKTITFTYKDGTTLTSTARPLPNKLKQPKPTPFSNHQQESDGPSLFATSA
jgi:hypothetical protein